MREITGADLKARLARGEAVYLVDVREPWEHQTAALPGGVLVPLGQLSGRIAEVRPPDGALVVTYCHHGMRSLQAASVLERAGFEGVCSLAGGIDAWSVDVDPAVPRY